jgi:hypothetical protein
LIFSKLIFARHVAARNSRGPRLEAEIDHESRAEMKMNANAKEENPIDPRMRLSTAASTLQQTADLRRKKLPERLNFSPIIGLLLAGEHFTYQRC